VAFKLDANVNLSPLAVTLGVNTHDYNPANLATTSILWITASSSVQLTGLAGGEERRVMFLGLRLASGANEVTIPAESASSAAGNRFADAMVLSLNGTGGAHVVVAVVYLGSRWRRWKF
jgi:hypothetical protein